MAKVKVSRQQVDEENNLSWVEQEIEEEDLLPNEHPLPEFPFIQLPT